ncbi:deoxyribodipyrimidine photo-lyase [Cladophialophora yegresii CBS 114405]|uniref:Deoxyribodipyrimidine photo-lyase n=1 Tax=Cladophialophora yegresii CBS 114405 TaxID=1182544 RepID=W9WT49_9EURO|nr:deoxyribodipyrimidine photo-lyase [Cladophialophora yegresii CBS 114405]EXJ61509.1 deoxyribodipyrimidine photo-lyase [Cladophialophora yegresii CBS 114405]
MIPYKRKESGTTHPLLPDLKRPRTSQPTSDQQKDSTNEIKYGIVLRKFYPPEMINERALAYNAGKIERPIETLENAISETQPQRDSILPGKCVVHWYKCDTRTMDNRALHLASETAAKHQLPLLCFYLISPQDFEAHLTAPIRVDFILRNLQKLKEDLSELDIPLYVETVERRRELPSRLIELCTIWGASHVYCNAEYEVDELRREATLTRSCLGKGISFNVIHDTCVVQPGCLKSGAGGALSVYSPWHRKWCAYLNEHPEQLDAFPPPKKNPPATLQAYPDLFACKIPDAPKSKQLREEEKTRFHTMWPAGEHEARARLSKFILERILKYHEHRNLPGGNATSNLSAHLAAGTLAARTVVREARDAAPSKRLTDDRKQGHSMWIGEVAWRDFYRHVLCHWPYICMNKPFKPEYSNIEWEYDLDQFGRWTDGNTGFPIVDAAMRQARHTGYMHNRCRMIVASFLAKDLLIDWRMGEKWFMEHLIDGDFASNNGGWGFSASVGVDPQPYFRIFNPLLQSEKFDLEGNYIRKWIPELAGIKDKGIHDPYGRGYAKIAEVNGYPRPMVDHKKARERALARYKAGIGRDTA